MFAARKSKLVTKSEVENHLRADNRVGCNSGLLVLCGADGCSEHFSLPPQYIVFARHLADRT